MLNIADIARQVITLGALCFSSNDVIAKKNVFMPVFAYLQAKWKCYLRVLQDNENEKLGLQRHLPKSDAEGQTANKWPSL